jgi:hypothetical protein
MTLWLQHLLVLLMVAACVAVVAFQAVRTLRGRGSRLGSCCAKGCEGNTPAAPSSGKRIIFLPVEMLGDGSKRRK